MAADSENKTPRSLRADGEATYRRILECAGELIGEAGFAETSNKAVAAAAGVDLASINYHFGSRSGLYQAVLAEAHRRFISMEMLKELTGSGLGAHEKLRTVIAAMADSLGNGSCWHSRVLGREMLSPTSHLQVLQETEVFPKFLVLRGIIGEITGIPPEDARVARCIVSVFTPCSMMFLIGRRVPAFAATIFGGSPDELVGHLYRFALGGLEAVAKEAASAPRAKRRSSRTEA